MYIDIHLVAHLVIHIDIVTIYIYIIYHHIRWLERGPTELIVAHQ
jgi:hypothetical protein